MAVTKIPIQLLSIEGDGYHLMMECLINDKPANFIIDSGASRTVLDQNLIELFIDKKEVEIEDNDTLSTGLGTNSMPSQAIYLKSIKIGELEINNYQAVIIDLSHVNDTYSKLALPLIHGVFGSDLLFKYKAVIYYKEKLLKFRF